MPAKRKLSTNELRFIISAGSLDTNARLRVGRVFHVARVRFDGIVIRACDRKDINLLAHYCTTFFRFIYDQAPVCKKCIAVLSSEGIAPPSSNTGVNSELRRSDDDA